MSDEPIITTLGVCLDAWGQSWRDYADAFGFQTEQDTRMYPAHLVPVDDHGWELRTGDYEDLWGPLATTDVLAVEMRRLWIEDGMEALSEPRAIRLARLIYNTEALR